MEQLVARQAHNLEVVRSSRASATTRSQTDTATSVRLLFSYPSPSPDSPPLRRQQPPAKQQSTARKRRGATCDARMTDEKQQSTAHKRRGTTRDARITDAKQHSTTRKRRGATCDARMTDAVPQTNRHKTTNQPAPRPHPPTRNATDHMCRSGTGRHKWRPHGLRHKPAAIHDGRGDGTHTVCPVRGAMCSLRTGQVACRYGRRDGQRSAAISSAFASSASRAICKLRSAMS